jgi:hypothetical protein
MSWVLSGLSLYVQIALVQTPGPASSLSNKTLAVGCVVERECTLHLLASFKANKVFAGL